MIFVESVMILPICFFSHFTSMIRANFLKACIQKYLSTIISLQSSPAALATQITKLLTLKLTQKPTDYNLMSHVAIL